MNEDSKPASPWHHLRDLLAYPSRRGLLGAITGLALARLLSYFLGSAVAIHWWPRLVVEGGVRGAGPLLLCGFVELILWFLAFKLAVEALLNTAHDRLDPDKAGPQSATDQHAFGQMLLLLVFLGPVYLLALRNGPDLGWLALAAVLVTLPAAVILLAVDESLWHALDPRAWLALVGRLGAAYFGVVVGLGVLAALVIGIQSTLLAPLPGWLAALASRFLSLYALLVAYHVLGRLLFQQHENLGIDLTPVIVRPVLANLEEDATLRAADALLAEDKPVEAADCLQALIARRGASAPIHARYRALLLAQQDLARLSQHGRDYASALLALGQARQALALVAESRALDPAFEMVVPEDITRLITQAVASGQSQQAVELAAGFGTRFPRNADVVPNTLIAARLMAERFGREAEAKALLEALALRYPEPPQAAEIELALAQVTRLLAISQRKG